MKVLILILLAAVTSGAALAQGRPPRNESRTVERAYRIADLLARQIDRLSYQQEQDINRSLDDIVATMRGGQQQPQGSLTCVSRDNDNRDPWILAYEENPLTITRFPQAVFGTQQNCQNMITTMRSLDGYRNLFCSTRDGDGRDPWQLTIFDEMSRTVKVVPGSSVGNLAACSVAMNGAQLYGDDLAMCVTRDNDGRDPWVLIMYKANGSVEKRNEVFSSYAQCATKL